MTNFKLQILVPQKRLYYITTCFVTVQMESKLLLDVDCFSDSTVSFTAFTFIITTRLISLTYKFKEVPHKAFLLIHKKRWFILIGPFYT